MGNYLNPGNEMFATVRRGKYVDKSGLLAVVNQTIGSKDKLTCMTRARRFGKSFVANMLCAYYDRTCDSDGLFRDLAIAGNAGYRTYLNQFNVLYLDITSFLNTLDQSGAVKDISTKVIRELEESFPEAERKDNLPEMLLSVVNATGVQFVCIIDEWDAIFREAEHNTALQKEYILFLRGLFKNGSVTDRVFAAAYMTGILPIKKYGTQSAISDFREYTMIDPGPYAPFFGFTQEEVKNLCREYGRSFRMTKKWYDGYSFPGYRSIYNPNSVMMAMKTGNFISYWSSSETYESLRIYIEMNEDGLQESIIQMLGGESVPVDTLTFQNDMTTLKSRDDVLTLLVHLGYLSYHQATKTVSIPNEEIRQVFISTLRAGTHTETSRLVRNSDLLLKNTIEGNEKEVAEAIQEAHDAGTAPLFYNDEQALRAVVKVAYISCLDHYIRMEELPSGHGYADIVFIPKKKSPFPAMIVELKMNSSTDTALDQIEEKNYPQVLQNYGSPVLAVAITYDGKTKKHECSIRKVDLSSG